MQAIQRDLSAVREQANNKEMSEIKGISTRFAQLDLHFQKIEGNRLSTNTNIYFNVYL